jgi:hypothetical protein
VRTTDSISKSIARRGAARQKDLDDALHAPPPKSEQKAQKKARKANAVKLFADQHSISVKEAKKVLKQRRKRGKKAPDPATGPLPTGSLPSSAAAADGPVRKGVFAPDLVKDRRGVDPRAVLRAELERQARDSENPAVRLIAEKTLAGQPPKRPEDDPAYWHRRAARSLNSVERNQFLAKAEELERPDRSLFVAGSYAQ